MSNPSCCAHLYEVPMLDLMGCLDFHKIFTWIFIKKGPATMLLFLLVVSRAMPSQAVTGLKKRKSRHLGGEDRSISFVLLLFHESTYTWILRQAAGLKTVSAKLATRGTEK
ncbi:unnamed protein product [Polarella glacialis]|uniref:Uncharacterized protein n=1 Tax=Polarella glacialis TaxID=89957 RepID=A0A813JUD1_POLGL|nr:unnamed protein product [Polarella glacialis]